MIQIFAILCATLLARETHYVIALVVLLLAFSGSGHHE